MVGLSKMQTGTRRTIVGIKEFMESLGSSHQIGWTPVDLLVFVSSDSHRYRRIHLDFRGVCPERVTNYKGCSYDRKRQLPPEPGPIPRPITHVGTNTQMHIYKHFNLFLPMMSILFHLHRNILISSYF